jgi:Predicted transcriptional regulator
MSELEKIVRMRTVLSRTGLSRSTIYRKIAEGTFPAQMKISTNSSGWYESDINRWIANPSSWRATINNGKGTKRDDRIDTSDVVQRSSSNSSS